MEIVFGPAWRGNRWVKKLKSRGVPMIDPNATGRQMGAYKCAAQRTGLPVEEWIARHLSGSGWCYRCRSWKAQAEFSIDRSRASGYASICKPCCSDASTASRYGITRKRLAEIRGSPCAICGRTEFIVVDHCHKSGRVRDGLCQRCNSAIGLFGDDPEMLAKAMAYLEKHHG